jgi:sialate O-acetylesterase
VEKRSPISGLVIVFASAAVLLGADSVRADVQVAELFTEHAVLQRDRPLPVWGWADAGEKVRISLGKESGVAVTGTDGRWQVTLKPQPVSKTALTLKVEGKKLIEIKDVLLGDVWLCSGQSNMEWVLGGCNAPEDIRTAELPLVRQFGVEYNFAVTPQMKVKGRWVECSPQTAPGFTAVGFYFARRVFKETGVPIGLVKSSVGGTNIELWISQETLMNTPAIAAYGNEMRNSLSVYQKELADAVPAFERWTAKCREEMKAGRPLPGAPALPEFPFSERVQRPRCVTLFNGMIAPLFPFALRGVLWYQGESNAGDAASGQQYLEKKRAMLNEWRKGFGDANLPFYFVQLADWQQPNDNPAGGDGWAYMREAQLHCLTLPHTGMAVASDIGDAGDIHPKNKFDVGERLARWALANEYGKTIEVSGPLFRELKIEGNKARVRFDHVGGGLMVGRKEGLAPTSEVKDGVLKRFAIAGKDRKWVWADAKIDVDSVICTSPAVPNPVAVRYAFTMNPAGANLYNRDGLPASAFRSDDW